MASAGFTGKILKVDLTSKKIVTIDTAKYEEFGGGYGTAIALFWDICVKPGDWDLQDAYDPRNIITIMNGQVSGAGIPYAGRTSISGLSPQGWPVNWFTRSNIGGDFGTMLKFAGWDGIVVQGRSDKPVYINIINDKVTIEDASKLWGLHTWDTQKEIVKQQTGSSGDGKRDWREIGDNYTLNKPAIICTGQAGENLSRVASLQHGGGAAAGVGGFGGLFGSKKLKAISVIGTGGFKVADPKIILETREWYTAPAAGMGGMGGFGGFGGPQLAKSSCIGCVRGCRSRGQANSEDRDQDGCMETTWADIHKPATKNEHEAKKANPLLQQYGLNGFDTCFGGLEFGPSGDDFPLGTPEASGLGYYIKRLYDAGVIGPGKSVTVNGKKISVDTAPLQWDKYGTYEFAETYVKAISKREGFGGLIADGAVRFAEKIGRIDDLNGILRCPTWGHTDHWSMAEVTWGYGDLVDSRDICDHVLQMVFMMLGMGGSGFGGAKKQQNQDPEAFVMNLTKAFVPYDDDPFMFDYSWDNDQAYKTGIYSEHKAKLVAWRMHYHTYYKESLMFCDWNWAKPTGMGEKGTPFGEPRLYNAVTGKNQTFLEGMEIGRKAWNLKRAIYALQGRHKDNEKFAGYMYKPGASGASFTNTLPVYDGTKWAFENVGKMYLSEKGVETWKTHYYNIEGWDPNSGYPTQKTLEKLGMKDVASILKKNNKLGAA
ncbi:MAG: hypothetical protein GX654_15190 [Desulfatiglans sp.]|nr:hypothetical protein [Desulfatiglans sp.]